MVLRLSLLGAAVLPVLPVTVSAQILVDRNAPAQQRPTVLRGANDVPVVNVQTPSTAGVSHNVYRQFDVGAGGVVFNNAPGGAPSQLAGQVPANPWLAAGAARIIVNQVNSNDPSQLRGPMEVAGQAAQVVVANPAGITCTGCGFINAHRATLTSGTPVLANGNLAAYRVQGGRVDVAGDGLYGGIATYAEIITRASHIGAKARAGRLKLVTGIGTVAAASGDFMTAAEEERDGAPPQLAIDVAQLGGLYADHIFLLSNEYGVGVRNDGSLGALAGELVLQVNGRLESRGQLAANEALRLRAGEFENQAGAQVQAPQVDIQADDGVINHGEIVGEHARIDAAVVDNRGVINGSQVRIDAIRLVNGGGGRIYGDRLAVAARQLINRADADDGTQGNEAGAPVIAARDSLDLGVEVLENQDHALIHAEGDLAVGGALDAEGRATGRAHTINNRSATIQAERDMRLAADGIHNLNDHLETGEQHSTGARIVRFRTNGSPQFLTPDETRLFNRGSGQILSAWNWRAMGDEDNFRLLLSSPDYPFARYGPPLDYSRGYRRSEVGIAYEAGSSASNARGRGRRLPEQYHYRPEDPIWDVFGIERPTAMVPDRPDAPSPDIACDDNECANANYHRRYPQWQRDEAHWRAVRDAQLPRYLALNAAILAFNHNLAQRQAPEWTIYDGVEQIVRTKVLRSDPALIGAGRDLHFTASRFNNYASQVVAGRRLGNDQADGAVIDNSGPPGVQTVTSTGSATYTFIKSHRSRADDRRYESVPYAAQTIVTHFPLPIGQSAANPDAVAQMMPSLPATPEVIRKFKPDATQIALIPPQYLIIVPVASD